MAHAQRALLRVTAAPCATDALTVPKHIDTADALAEDAAPPTCFSDLPEELLLLILAVMGSALTVLNMARVCSALSSATRTERLWQIICNTTWPLLLTERRCPPVHLQTLPPSSWRMLYQSRVAAAKPAGWCELLPLYDSCTRAATERRAGWVVEVGLTLLRIERVRTRHRLPISPIREQQSMVSSLLPRHSESFCWARTMQHELLAGCVEILAIAGDPVSIAISDAARVVEAERAADSC